MTREPPATEVLRHTPCRLPPSKWLSGRVSHKLPPGEKEADQTLSMTRQSTLCHGRCMPAILYDLDHTGTMSPWVRMPRGHEQKF